MKKGLVKREVFVEAVEGELEAEEDEWKGIEDEEGAESAEKELVRFRLSLVADLLGAEGVAGADEDADIVVVADISWCGEGATRLDEGSIRASFMASMTSERSTRKRMLD